jgi:hypothetical protein
LFLFLFGHGFYSDHIYVSLHEKSTGLVIGNYWKRDHDRKPDLLKPIIEPVIQFLFGLGLVPAEYHSSCYWICTYQFSWQNTVLYKSNFFVSNFLDLYVAVTLILFLYIRLLGYCLVVSNNRKIKIVKGEWKTKRKW